MLHTGVIPCLIQLPLLFFIPESPRWLVGLYIMYFRHTCGTYINRNFLQANVGREKDFEATLQRLRGSEADVSDEAAEIRVMLLLIYMSDFKTSFNGINFRLCSETTHLKSYLNIKRILLTSNNILYYSFILFLEKISDWLFLN